MIKKSILLTIFIAGLLMFISSCEKKEIVNTSKKQVNVSEKDKKAILEISKLYERSFIDVLSDCRLKTQAENNYSNIVSYKIDSLFEKRISQKFYNNIPEKSFNGIENINEIKLQGYLNILAKKMISHNESIDSLKTKEQILNDLKGISKLYIMDISKDETLSENERLVIMENIMLRSSLLITTLKYGEDIKNQGITEKGFWDWYYRNQAEIICTIWSAMAVATCATAVITQNPASWAACVVATIKATACWVNI